MTARANSTQDTINELLTKNHWVLEQPYVASFKPLKLRCSQAHTWSVLPSVLIKNPCCPQCGAKESPVETIAKLLKSMKLTFETKVSHEELPDKTFDFVVDLEGRVVYIDLDDATSFDQEGLTEDTTEEIEDKIAVLTEQDALLIRIASHLVSLREDLAKFLKDTFKKILDGDYQDNLFFYKAEVYLGTQNKTTNKVSSNKSSQDNPTSVTATNLVEENAQPKFLNLQSPIVIEAPIEEKKADKVDIFTRFGLDPKQFIKIGEQSCMGYESPPSDPRLKTARSYCRVSSLDQSLSASMTVQRQRIQEYAKQNGYHIVNIYMDYGITGRKTERRPAFLRMMYDLKPGDTVITVALSRLSRSIVDTHNIIKDMKERFCRFICFDLPIDLGGSDLTNGLMLNLLACFAEFESKQTSSRVSSVLNNLSASGDLRTKPRFGWKKDTTPGINHKDVPFVRDEEEQKVIEFIRGLKLNNPKFTLTEICNILNNSPEGNVRRKANRWYHGTLRRICEANDIPIGECNQSVKNNPAPHRTRQQENKKLSGGN